MAHRSKVLQPSMALGHGQFTVEAADSKDVKGETAPRRHPTVKQGLVGIPEEGIETVYDLVINSFERYGNAKAMGTRRIIQTHKETRKVKQKDSDGNTHETSKDWSYYELSSYSFMSYVQYKKLVEQLASGLRGIGMKADEKLHVYAATSPHWLAIAHAAAFQRMPIVTAYETLGVDGLRHSLKQTESAAVFCEPSLMKALIETLDTVKTIRYVVYNNGPEVSDGPDQALVKKLEESNIKVVSFEQLRSDGEANPVAAVKPRPDDLFGIMYTSGSSGPPKGVPIKHKAVISAVAGLNTIVGPYVGPGDGVLAYLPLAHIFEFVVENACVYLGLTMGYGNPKTLSDTSVRNCNGDIKEFRPSLMVGVPAVWESVRKGILAQVEGQSAIAKSIFWGALSAKEMMLSYGIPGTGILNAVVFDKIKMATGGKMKFCLNGGGPLSDDTQRFISMTICPMVGAYGLTETTAMGAIQDPQQWNPSAVGIMPTSVEVKLVDHADANYFSNSIPPQGEVWIRGDPVMEAYYKNEKETREAKTSDGWFKTGDIGEFDRNGQLRIIDRKKNLVKTLNGEYIALEKLESVYRTSKFVSNICVHASSDESKPIAIIVPVEAELKKLASQKNVDSANGRDPQTKEGKLLYQAVLEELQAAGKAGGLTGIEIIVGIVLADEEWTPQNGFLTAAQKIQRKPILEKYQDGVNRAYGKPS